MMPTIDVEIVLREKRIRGRAKQPSENEKDTFRVTVHNGSSYWYRGSLNYHGI